MKLKPMLNTEDFKRVLKNGDLKSKSREEVLKLMEMKNFTPPEIADVMDYCKEENIKFNKPRHSCKGAINKVAPKYKKSSSYGSQIRKFDLLTPEDERKLNFLIRKAKNARQTIKFLDENDIISSFSQNSIDFLEIYYEKPVNELLDDYRNELKKEIEEGKKAREKFINCNLRLVISISRKHMVSGMSLDDLIQEGNIGLMKAVDKYDARRGIRFATMASWWIDQAITRSISNKSRTIRVPVHIWEKNAKVKTYEKKYIQEHGKKPSLGEYANFLDTTPEKARHILESMQNITSLDTTIPNKKKDDETSTLLNLIAEEVTDTEKILNQQFLKESIDEIVQNLDFQANEKQMFIKRFGLGGAEPMSYPELAKIFDTTTSRVSRTVEKIVECFRTPERMNLLSGYYADI